MNEPDRTSLRAEYFGIPKRFEDCGFKNFKTSPENQSKYDLCLEFSKKLDSKESLFLFGNVGTGKSHLSVAIMKNLAPVKKEMKVSSEIKSGDKKKLNTIENLYAAKSIFLVVDEFFQELNDCAVNRESKQAVINKYLNEYDLVVLDDLGIVNWSNAKQENLYLFINRAYLDCKRIIITTNFTPEELQQKDERITSRLKEMGKFLKFNGKDYRK